MSLPVRLFGPTEVACRFFGAVGAGLASLLVFYISKKLLSAQVALWAMIIFATTIMMLSMGTVATADAVLMPSMFALMAVFVHSYETKMKLIHVILMGLLAGFAMLTKGPLAIFPFLAMIVTLLLMRKPLREFLPYGLKISAAFLIGGLIFAAWGLPANNATGGEFLRLGIGHHVIERTAKPLEHHGGNFLLYLPYYLPAIIWGFFPWTLHLPGAVSAVITGRVCGKFTRTLLIGWFVPTFIIMSLISTKLPHYILFTWPALALAVAATLTAANENILSERDRKWLRGGIWFFLPVAAGLILALLIAPWFSPVSTLRFFGSVSGVILLIVSIFAVRLQLDNNFRASAKVLVAGLLIFYVPFTFGVLPAIENLKISPAISNAVKTATKEDIPVATYKFAEPTLNFYIGRHIEPLRNEQAVVEWIKQPGSRVLISTTEAIENIKQKYGPLAVDQLISKKGFNYSNGTELEVVALVSKKVAPE
jgi:4-amino-4-deoxy-L-arabinose transferase-like glycosyltransferase